MVNWAKPGPTTGVVALTGLLLILLHSLIVCLANGRDAVSKRFLRAALGVGAEEIPLQRPIQAQT